MADEIKDGAPTEPVAPQRNELEIRASEQGWVPEDEWAGDPNDWRPAKEFLDRGELFKKIDEQKRELRQLKQTMDEFGKHHARVRESEFQRAVESLKAQKKDALEQGDAAAVIEIDEKIAETRETAREAKALRPAPQQVGPNPDFVQWQQRNTWYGTDRAMKAVADEVARDLVSRGEAEPTRILKEVDREIRKAFPAKFENPARQRADAVEGTSKPVRTPKDDFHITDDERRIMTRVVATGVITREKYIEELKATRARS